MKLALVLSLGLLSMIGISQAPLPRPSAPPLPIPTNRSLVTAVVLKYSIWSPASLRELYPPLSSDVPVYSFLLEIQSAVKRTETERNLAQVSRSYEVFSYEPLPASLVGKEVEAVLQLQGDTRSGVRWWLEPGTLKGD